MSKRLVKNPVFSVGCGDPALLEDVRDGDADDVQAQHRNGHNYLRHHVGAGTDDCRDDEDQQKRVLEVLHEHAARDNAHASEEEDQRRHLEDRAEPEKHFRVERECLVDLWHEAHVVSREPGKELPGNGERDEVREQAARHEEDRRHAPETTSWSWNLQAVLDPDRRRVWRWGKARAPWGRLRAAVLAGDVPDAVIRAGGGRRGIVVMARRRVARSFLALGAAALFHADFFVQRTLQLVRGPLELGEAFAERFSEFRQLARPENDQGNRENNDEFREPDGAKHTRIIHPEKLLRLRSMRTRRFLSVTALAVLLSALAGGFFGSSAQATQDQVAQQYRVFTAALAAIDREYVESLPSDRLIYDAVGGMLQTLDPQ